MKKIVEKIKGLSKRKVAKNAMWMIGERIFQMILSLFIGIVSARYLGPENYGTLQYGAALVTLVSAIAKLGLDNIIVKEYVNRKDENGLVLGSVFAMRMISGLLSIVSIMTYTFIFNGDDNTIIITTFLQSFILIFEAYDLIDFWFQSQLKSKYVSIAKTIAYVVMAIYKIVLLVLGKSVEWFAFATSLEYIIILIILFVMYLKNGGQKLQFSFYEGKKLIKQGYHFILASLLITLYTQMDKIMIGELRNETEVGLYSIAVAISTIRGFIPNAIIISMRPTIYEAKKNNEEIYQKRLIHLYALVFWCGIIFALGTTIFADFIVDILYGEQYKGAEGALRIVSWSTIFAYLGTARSVWIVCEDKNKYSKKYVFWGAVINLILNLIMIPKIGIIGAAIATLIAQIIVAIIAPLFYKETKSSVTGIIDGILLKGVK